MHLYLSILTKNAFVWIKQVEGSTNTPVTGLNLQA